MKELDNSCFKWFGNDSDGLSIMDTLTIAMFIFFIIFKFLHIYISIEHSDSMSLLSQFNLIMSSLDEFMRLITIFYFSEKTLDNTITKLGDIKNNKINSDFINNTKPNIDNNEQIDDIEIDETLIEDNIEYENYYYEEEYIDSNKMEEQSNNKELLVQINLDER